MRPTISYYENLARQSIIEAMLKLMETEDFQKLSITKICQEAKVARRTFYLYYESKYSVLEDYFAVLTREFDSRFKGDLIFGTLSQYEIFFTFWYEHRNYLQLLYKQHLFHTLLEHFNYYLINRAKFEKREDVSNYDFAFSSGGLWAVLYVWTTEDFKETPSKLAIVVSRI